MLINLIVGNHLLCVCISTYHIVHFKNIQFFLIFNPAPINLGEKILQNNKSTNLRSSL